METIAIGSSEGMDEIRASLELQFRRAGQRDGFQVGLQEVDRGRWRFIGCRLDASASRNGGDVSTVARRCVADALGEVICGQWEGRLVRRLIRAHYDYFDAEEQERIFGYASHQLQQADATRGAGISRRARVLARLQEYLEAHNNLILDGFVTFRLKEYVEELEEAVDRAVDDYLLEREYEEFVHLLRHFVESQEPRVDTVHVVRLASGGFHIQGADGAVLRADALTGYAPGAPGADIESDDVLISALVTMAPRTIHLHRLAEYADLRDAVETMRRVFAARLKECSGCSRCRARRGPRGAAGDEGRAPRSRRPRISPRDAGGAVLPVSKPSLEALTMRTDIPTSKILEALPRSGIREIASLAGERPGLVHLEYGEPSLPTPEVIRRAVADAVRERRMVYTPVHGPEALREEICRKIERVNGYRAGPGQVFVTHGGTGAVFLALSAVLNPGDRVLLPDPGWPNTVGMAMVLGARPEFYTLDPANGFLPDPDAWPIGSDCRAVVLNNPANPTGAVYPRELLERVADVARRHGLWVIADEVYDQIHFDRRPVAMATLYPERTLSVYSFSKTYAMTGWRLGYLVGPEEAIGDLQKVAESVFSSTSMPAQIGALTALREAGDAIPGMVAAYRRSRDTAVRLAREWGMYRYTPEGAFYLMVDVSAAGDAREVARRLVSEKGVVAVPGTAFGRSAANFLRISLAASETDIEAGLRAIRDLIAAT